MTTLVNSFMFPYVLPTPDDIANVSWTAYWWANDITATDGQNMNGVTWPEGSGAASWPNMVYAGTDDGLITYEEAGINGQPSVRFATTGSPGSRGGRLDDNNSTSGSQTNATLVAVFTDAGTSLSTGVEVPIVGSGGRVELIRGNQGPYGVAVNSSGQRDSSFAEDPRNTGPNLIEFKMSTGAAVRYNNQTVSGWETPTGDIASAIQLQFGGQASSQNWNGRLAFVALTGTLSSSGRSNLAQWVNEVYGTSMPT